MCMCAMVCVDDVDDSGENGQHCAIESSGSAAAAGERAVGTLVWISGA
jgi:hypothetical protein